MFSLYAPVGYPSSIHDSCVLQPNRSWIIKSYTNHAVLTPTEHCFNAKLCGVRCIVERLFGLLKSRWQILLKQNEQKLKYQLLVQALLVLCIIFARNFKIFTSLTRRLTMSLWSKSP